MRGGLRVSFRRGPKVEAPLRHPRQLRDRIPQLAPEKNIPLKKVAKDLGLSIATINSWESGKQFPTGYNFEMLADYTGVPPCRLFCVMADKCVPAECLLAMPKKKR